MSNLPAEQLAIVKKEEKRKKKRSEKKKEKGRGKVKASSFWRMRACA